VLWDGLKAPGAGGREPLRPCARRGCRWVAPRSRCFVVGAGGGWAGRNLGDRVHRGSNLLRTHFTRHTSTPGGGGVGESAEAEVHTAHKLMYVVHEKRFGLSRMCAPAPAPPAPPSLLLFDVSLLRRQRPSANAERRCSAPAFPQPPQAPKPHAMRARRAAPPRHHRCTRTFACVSQTKSALRDAAARRA
jgi:hypothetical protein